MLQLLVVKKAKLQSNGLGWLTLVEEGTLRPIRGLLGSEAETFHYLGDPRSDHLPLNWPDGGEAMTYFDTLTESPSNSKSKPSASS